MATSLLLGLPSVLLARGDHTTSTAPEVFEVTTRGDFNNVGALCCATADSYRVVSGGGSISDAGGVVSVPVDLLSDYYARGCGNEVTVVVHGFQNDEFGALEKFNRVLLSLRANNYYNPIIGYSWQSDSGLTIVDQWYFANQVAILNGLKFAAFLTDFKKQCGGTDVRILAHSLGARLVTETVR